MYEAIPMCVICGQKEVQIVVNSTGAGYCSPECEASYNEDEADYFASWRDEQEEIPAGREAEYDAWLSQYDDDPSVYAGDYSEE